MFHNSLTISLQYRDTNATVPSFHASCFWFEPKIHCRDTLSTYISVDHKQTCVQTVANHRLEETKKALIRNTEVKAKVIVSVFDLRMCACVCVCVCVFLHE